MVFCEERSGCFFADLHVSSLLARTAVVLSSSTGTASLLPAARVPVATDGYCAVATSVVTAARRGVRALVDGPVALQEEGMCRVECIESAQERSSSTLDRLVALQKCQLGLQRISFDSGGGEDFVTCR